MIGVGASILYSCDPSVSAGVTIATPPAPSSAGNVLCFVAVVLLPFALSVSDPVSFAVSVVRPPVFRLVVSGGSVVFLSSSFVVVASLFESSVGVAVESPSVGVGSAAIVLASS